MSARRTLLIADECAIERVGDALYELNLGSTAPETLVAELSLVAGGLADSLTLRRRSGGVRVEIARGEVRRRAVAEPGVDTLRLTLSETELGYWLAYFLRYYRDGGAEVDHLDVEAETSSGGGVDVRVCVSRTGGSTAWE